MMDRFAMCNEKWNYLMTLLWASNYRLFFSLHILSSSSSSSLMITCLLHPTEKRRRRKANDCVRNLHAESSLNEPAFERMYIRWIIRLWRDSFDRSQSLMNWFGTGSSCTLIVQLFENSFDLHAEQFCISSEQRWKRTKRKGEKVLIKNSETHKGLIKTATREYS